MKKLIACILFLFTSSYAIADCEPKVLRIEKDQIGWTLTWFDKDCDDKCDIAILEDSNGVPRFAVICDIADNIQKQMEEMTKIEKKKGGI
jgi:hypothetical protein